MSCDVRHASERLPRKEYKTPCGLVVLNLRQCISEIACGTFTLCKVLIQVGVGGVKG